MHWNSCPCLLQSDWVTATAIMESVKTWLAKPPLPCATATFTVTPPTVTDTPAWWAAIPALHVNLYPNRDNGSHGNALQELVYDLSQSAANSRTRGYHHFYYKNEQDSRSGSAEKFYPGLPQDMRTTACRQRQDPQPPWSVNLTNLNLSNGLLFRDRLEKRRPAKPKGYESAHSPIGAKGRLLFTVLMAWFYGCP